MAMTPASRPPSTARRPSALALTATGRLHAHRKGRQQLAVDVLKVQISSPKRSQLVDAELATAANVLSSKRRCSMT